MAYHEKRAHPFQHQELGQYWIDHKLCMWYNVISLSNFSFNVMFVCLFVCLLHEPVHVYNYGIEFVYMHAP